MSTNLSYAVPAFTGTDPAFAPADASGNTLAATNNGFLAVRNDGASAITVTLATPGQTRFGQDEPDITINVPAASERLIGPMISDLVDPATKAITVTYSDVASVTVAAIRT